MRISAFLIAVSTLVSTVSTNASTVQLSEFICPIGHEKFSEYVALSGTQFGVALDRKPYGPIISPWPIARCPGNGFVIFKDDFTKEELATLESFVLSAQYQKSKNIESNYYLKSMLIKQLGQPLDAIANTLLRATWEAESDDRYPRYARETIEAIDALVANSPNDTEKETLLIYTQVAGELERRLGLFDAAESRLRNLQRQHGVDEVDLLQGFIDQELALIAARDANPHRFGEKSPE